MVFVAFLIDRLYGYFVRGLCAYICEVELKIHCFVNDIRILNYTKQVISSAAQYFTDNVYSKQYYSFQLLMQYFKIYFLLL